MNKGYKIKNSSTFGENIVPNDTRVFNIRKATVHRDKEVLNFFFPDVFGLDEVSEAIKAIRTGDRRHWKREFRDAPLLIENVCETSFECKMKYIVLHDKKDDKKRKYMVVFPIAINHDFMMEVVQHAVFDCDFPDNISPIMKFSAGFVEDGQCGGKSETLNIASDKDDTELFRKTFNFRK